MQSKLKSMAFGACMLLSMFGHQTLAHAEDVTLTYSNWLPTTFFLWTDVFEPLFTEIEEATDGRVKIDVLPKVVGTPATQFEIVSDGLADMSFTIASYTPGRFVGSEIGSLPLLGNNAESMGPAFFRHFKKYIEPAGEFDGVKVLSMYIITPFHPHTANRPIRTIEDFEGMKLRAPTPGLVAAVQLLGGVPITKSAAEAFEMLATGSIDGQITISNTVPGFKQLKLMKYVTIIPGGLSNGVNFMFVNPDKWEQISKADRATIEQLTGEKLAADVGRAYLNADAEALKIMKDAGYEIIQGDEKLRQDLARLLKPVEQEWIEAAKAKGYADPEAQLAELRAAIARGEK